MAGRGSPCARSDGHSRVVSVPRERNHTEPARTHRHEPSNTAILSKTTQRPNSTTIARHPTADREEPLDLFKSWLEKTSLIRPLNVVRVKCVERYPRTSRRSRRLP